MPSSSSSSFNLLYNLVWISLVLYGIGFCAIWAYKIRLLAIEEFGPIIHEFDPYFNYRATEYLYDHGWKKFVTWFDYMVWYPLGRPVGTTIYPGMQVTAVWIKHWITGDTMSLNDVCCYMPAWFGVLASVVTGLMAYECSLPQSTEGSVLSFLMDIFRGKNGEKEKFEKRYSPAVEIGVVSMGIMAIVPAHLMRSIGGGYDNESVAVTAMTLTFYLWCRSLRAHDDKSYWYGIMAGVAYFYMAASWGGYIFVLNMVGAHAAFLVLLGRFSEKLHKAYSLFYVVGTLLAIQIPIVGLSPLKSLEQLGPCAVFFGMQILAYCDFQIRKQKLTRWQGWKLRIKISILALGFAVLFIYLLAPKGYFGPISSRVRGLFVKHTRTGNPLVDSVAEHQPASHQAYFQYLHYLYYVAPAGWCLVLCYFGDAPSFLVLYGLVAYFFSAKMVRLILLLAPIASTLGGVCGGRVMSWCLERILGWLLGTEETREGKKGKEQTKEAASTKKKKKKAPGGFAGVSAVKEAMNTASKSKEGMVIKRIMSLIGLGCLFIMARHFKDYSWVLCKSLSQATIVIKGRTRSGEEVLVDDYREAYFWLKDNTPQDSRILAWWDYGYQITAIANRTTLADGNTWNHEHIALLGKILTTDVEEGYEIARHLADYALIWAGGGGDDLAKSPHLARIANSVYRDMCPGDPTCRAFGFVDQRGNPSPMMERSFLFKLHSHNLKPGVVADPTKFKEVFRSKYGKVRIYKILGVSRASKDWVANPKNRICDVEGGWYCKGQYPPALSTILSKKKDFAQLEDFNVDHTDEEYTKKYFENMEDPSKAKAEARKLERDKIRSSPKQTQEDGDLEHMISLWKSTLTDDQISQVYNNWEDKDSTTEMWRIVTEGAVDEFTSWLSEDPLMAFLRSSDGRGPMWWAYEAANREIAYILTKLGVSNKDKDKYGMTPSDLLPEGARKKKKKKKT